MIAGSLTPTYCTKNNVNTFRMQQTKVKHYGMYLLYFFVRARDMTT